MSDHGNGRIEFVDVTFVDEPDSPSGDANADGRTEPPARHRLSGRQALAGVLTLAVLVGAGLFAQHRRRPSTPSASSPTASSLPTSPPAFAGHNTGAPALVSGLPQWWPHGLNSPGWVTYGQDSVRVGNTDLVPSSVRMAVQAALPGWHDLTTSTVLTEFVPATGAGRATAGSRAEFGGRLITVRSGAQVMLVRVLHRTTPSAEPTPTIRPAVHGQRSTTMRLETAGYVTDVEWLSGDGRGRAPQQAMTRLLDDVRLTAVV